MNSLAVLVVSAALSNAQQGVLLDFSASYCAPCQQMKPVVHRLQRQGWPVQEVDVVQRKDLARKYNVKNIPCFVLVVGGQEVTRSVGATSEAQLRRMLAMIPRPEPQLLAESRPSSQPPQTPAQEIKTAQAAPNEPAPRFQLPLLDRLQDKPREQPQQMLAAATETPVIRAKFGRSDTPVVAAPLNDPLTSSVRIRIRDQKGINFGSGTIIDSRAGRSLILTCGHIFRDLKDDSLIEVDVFAAGRSETFVGEVVRYDEEADVGLIAVPTETPLTVCKIAAPAASAQEGHTAYSIGCGGGEAPSRLNVQITRLNRYLGPDNIECTGVPMQGRSGGGLFNGERQIIGVCIAADPKEQRGLYCGLKPIHDLLDQAQLTHLYRGIRPAESAEIALAKAEIFTPDRTPAAGHENRTEQAATSSEAANLKGLAAAGADAAQQVEQAIAAAGEAEVICIIRPLNKGEAASRVVVINRASSRFLSYLDGEMSAEPTSMPVAAEAAQGRTAAYRQ